MKKKLERIFFKYNFYFSIYIFYYYIIKNLDILILKSFIFNLYCTQKKKGIVNNSQLLNI